MGRIWDLIVVGGGITGCATAYYAARDGLSVLLVERDSPAAAQSGRNLGFVRQQGRDFRELELAIGANRIWRGIEAELGRAVGWVQGGNLALAFSDAALAEQADWQARAADYGLATRLIGPEDAARLCPALSLSGFLGAMHTASDGQAEPAQATRAFFDAARDSGCEGRIGAAVSALDIAAGSVAGVWVGDELLRARTVLCAAGTGSHDLLARANYRLPLERIRATVTRTAPRPDLRLKACLSGRSIGLRQDQTGAFVLSGTGGEYDLRLDSWRYFRAYAPTRKRNAAAFRINPLALFSPARQRRQGPEAPGIIPGAEHPRPEPLRVAAAMEEFAQLLPALAGTPVAASWAGIVDTLPDVVPALGPAEEIGGLLIAAGFSAHGFALGPMVGRCMADLALGRAPAVDLGPLSPTRFRPSGRQAPSPPGPGEDAEP